MATKMTVQILENDTENSRGFLSRETDENPNRNFEIRHFDDIDEVKAAIFEQIMILGKDFFYMIDTVDGKPVGMVYSDPDGVFFWDI